MTEELPEGWSECKTGDISQIVGGGTPDTRKEENFSTESGVPWLTPADLSGHDGIYVSRGKRFLTKRGFESSSAKLMPMGAVLFSSRAPIGYVAIAKNEISTNQGFKSFVCRDAVIAEYLYFWLKYATPLAEELAAGTTFAEISGTNAAKIPVLIPPLLEQRRIVERLEKLLAEVERCNERTTKIPVLLKRFRQSVLASACSGRLTSDWRETRNADSEWPTKPLSDLFIMRNGKSLTVAKRKKGTIPVYGGNGLMGVHSVGNVDGKVIVVGRVGAQCGNVHFTNGKVWVTDNAISLQARYELNPAFYALFLETQNLNQLSAGTGQPYVSQDILSSIEAPIVSLPEQDEITHRVNALFGLADNIEVRFKAVQQQVDRLPLSVLAKAFRGELVPTEAELAKREDRPYESAEELLQRIRHSREAVPPRGSRKRGKGATRSK